MILAILSLVSALTTNPDLGVKSPLGWSSIDLVSTLLAKRN